MVSLVDTVDSVGSVADIEKQLSEAVASNATAAKASTSLATQQQQNTQQVTKPAWKETVLDGDEVPEKFRGKTAAEVLESLRNLESAYGRMANDLGTQRKLTDRLLDLKRESDLTSNSQRRELPDVKSTELLENPAEVIDRIVSDRLKAQQEQTAQQVREAELATAQQRFFEHHPDFNEIAQDPEFTKWLQGSTYRQRAAASAQSGDWNAADDLLSEYKDRKQVRKPAKQEESPVDDNLQAARNASLESSAAPEHASSKKGKTYRRSDLIRLRLEKPDQYYSEDFQAEILAAYREKRVV